MELHKNFTSKILLSSQILNPTKTTEYVTVYEQVISTKLLSLTLNRDNLLLLILIL